MGVGEENTTEGHEEYANQLMSDVNLLRAKVETVEVTPDLLITGAVDLLSWYPLEVRWICENRG